MSKKKEQEKNSMIKRAGHHDILFKQGYSDPRFAKELFQLIFSEEEKRAFDWDSLASEKDTFHQDKRADLIFSISLKNKPGKVFKICLLLEHKSQYNQRIFLQLLNYQTFLIGKTFQETGSASPVIPVVFYHGKKPWKWKKVFQEEFWGASLAEMPVSSRRNMLNYELKVLDTHDPKVASIVRKKDFKSRGFLNVLKETWNLKADETLLNEVISLFDNWPGDRDDLTLSLGNYLWTVVPGMTKELWEAVERTAINKGIFSRGGYMNIREYIKEEGMQEGIQKGIQKGIQEGMQKGMQEGMQKGMQEGMQEGIQKGMQEGMQKGMQEGMQEGIQKGMQKGRQEGIQKGRQEGIQEGRQEVVLNMLAQKADISFIAKVTGLSEEEIRKLKNGD